MNAIPCGLLRGSFMLEAFWRIDVFDVRDFSDYRLRDS